MTTIVKRKFVIKQHLKKKTKSEILKIGKYLNMNPMFIKRTLDRYVETKNVQDRPWLSRPMSQRTKNLIKAVEKNFRGVLDDQSDKWQKSTIHQWHQCIECAERI